MFWLVAKFVSGIYFWTEQREFSNLERLKTCRNDLACQQLSPVESEVRKKFIFFFNIFFSSVI